jgi:polar amino acid transport system substrate-binding protein
MYLIRLVASFLVLACALGGAAQAQQCEPQRVAELYPLHAKMGVKIATVTTSPPFAFADPASYDHMTGAEVDVMQAVMQCAGLRFEWVKGPFSTLLQSVLSGATDVMVGNVNYRPDRARILDFVIYMRSGQSVLVLKGNPKKLLALADLCGMTASSTIGGASAAEVEKQSAACVMRGVPPINYIPSVDQEAALRQLANDRIDFVMDGSITAKQRAEGHDSEFENAFTILTDLVIGPAFRKDDEEMRRAVLGGVQVLERDGELKRIFSRYGLDEFAQPAALRH